MIAQFQDRGRFGGGNDLDVLEFSKGAVSDEEYRAHLAFLTALMSLLLIGDELRKRDADVCG